MVKSELSKQVSSSDFTVLHDTLVLNGVTYKRGDRLRPDDPVRKNPRRLEVLCRRRYIAPTPFDSEKSEERQSKPEKKAKPEKAIASKSKAPDFTDLTKIELRKRLKALDLSYRGKRVVLAARLAKHYATK